jgi:phage tail-like protein
MVIRKPGTQLEPKQSRQAFELTANCNFLVEVDGLGEGGGDLAGSFREVSGLVSRSEVLEYRVGNQATAMQIPGRAVYGNILLTRGVTTSDAFYLWRKGIEEGEEDLRNGSIVLLDAALRETARWNFYAAWPCRYEGPLLDISGEEISIETLELVVERLERVSDGEVAGE